jgi:serine/threonine protein kinase
MSAREACTECGRPLPPSGICPGCTLRGALEIGITPLPIFNPATLLTADMETEDHPLLAGYDQFERIAQGGMGVVYRARQKRLDRRVAVKMILTGRLATESEVQRFRQEAATAAKLHHPHIVAIHETGQAEGGLDFFSMDYVAGGDLARLVRDGPIDARRAAALVKTIGEAVHYAHECGVLHRDLKPANVLLDEFGDPRVTDFGLARLMDAPGQTITAEPVGTPGFMSPEQIEGGRITRATDVFSLGAILHYLLSGRPPFQEDSRHKTMRATLEGRYISPRALNPSVPLDLETICRKCMETDPERRYGTAQIVAEELGRFLRRVPI